MTDIIADLVQRVWPWAACRWFGWHDWIGEPINDRCRFCSVDIHSMIN